MCLLNRGITAEYPVAYQIGQAVTARSYAVQLCEYQQESPLS
jgi:hypothetical protein